MNALLYALRDTQRLRTFLFWYWLISPFIFFFYQFAVSRGENVDFREMLNEPAIALAFIVSCMSLMMVGSGQQKPKMKAPSALLACLR